MIIKNWDQYFMTMCYVVGMKSKDTSTTVGCVFVGADNEIRSTGYNNFIRGWDDNDPKNHERPYKYDITEHSERNAIYNAARVGIKLKNCRIYVPWHPCSNCARALVQCGITEVIIHKEFPTNLNQKWLDNQNIAGQLLKQGNVKLRMWSGSIPKISSILNGEEFDPTELKL